MSKKPQILLIGRRNEEIVGIKGMLARNTGYEVELVSVAQKAVQRLTQRDIDLCVFNFDLFTKEKIKLATELRGLGYNFPVLVLSRIIATDAFDAIGDMKSTILLEKPFEQKDLIGISEKMIRKADISQRIQRRFYTNQEASVSAFGGADKVDAKVFNLSRGGAYLEHKGNQNMAKGELVQVNIQLNEIYREYNVNARVVWSSQKGIWGTGKALGVEFVKTQDIYRDLLNKI
jgi:DNA-binding response OmpR family regulator